MSKKGDSNRPMEFDDGVVDSRQRGTNDMFHSFQGDANLERWLCEVKG